ncbi:hypothetical protein FKP32DRAFT_304431 [Trametes sanguinea]|nr:hypothetical protein FKP32DRAFT_304431 [Trametes sanguinea]
MECAVVRHCHRVDAHAESDLRVGLGLARRLSSTTQVVQPGSPAAHRICQAYVVELGQSSRKALEVRLDEGRHARIPRRQCSRRLGILGCTQSQVKVPIRYLQFERHVPNVSRVLQTCCSSSPFDFRGHRDPNHGERSKTTSQSKASGHSDGCAKLSYIASVCEDPRWGVGTLKNSRAARIRNSAMMTAMLMLSLCALPTPLHHRCSGL